MSITFGIEEEFIFLDPVTMHPADVAAGVIARLGAHERWSEVTKKEFLASQVEHASAVFTEVERAADELLGFRAELAHDAARLGMSVAGTGAPPEAEQFPTITPNERYQRVVDDMGGMIADHQFSGLHVHVGVPSREHGVIAMNSSRPWLPVLLAMSGNSPIWRGTETGYESWRTIALRRWTTAGCPPSFADAADYDRRIHRLLGIGGTSDLALLAWNVRLSAHLPTIEFRFADAQLTADDTLCITAICRGLVARAIEAFDDGTGETGDAGAPSELLSAAIVHSARDGLRRAVFDPVSGGLAVASDALDHLVEHVEPHLDAAGDLDFVREHVGRLVVDGTGAARQLRAFREAGHEGLRRLYADTITASTINRKFDAHEASAFLG